MPKQLNMGTLVSALVISAIIFSAGIFIGFSINKERLSSIEEDMGEINRYVQNFQLQFMFFDVLGENATCPLLTATLEDINEQSYKTGSMLTSSSQENDITDEAEYNQMLTQYSRLLINYWLLANKVKEACDMDSVTALFFISKSGCASKNSNVCDDQAFVLDYFKRKFNNKLLVFTLQLDLNEPSIQALKEYYEVDEVPTLIVEGEKYEGFQSTEDLREVLCGYGLCESE